MTPPPPPQKKKKCIHQQHLLANKNHTKIKICSSSPFFLHSFSVTEKPFFLVPQGSGWPGNLAFRCKEPVFSSRHDPYIPLNFWTPPEGILKEHYCHLCDVVMLAILPAWLTSRRADCQEEHQLVTCQVQAILCPTRSWVEVSLGEGGGEGGFSC